MKLLYISKPVQKRLAAGEDDWGSIKTAFIKAREERGVDEKKEALKAMRSRRHESGGKVKTPVSDLIHDQALFGKNSLDSGAANHFTNAEMDMVAAHFKVTDV